MASLPTATITPLVPPAAVTAEPTLITEAWVTPTTPLSDMTPLVPTAVVTAAPTLITESRVTPTIPLSDMAAQLDPFFDQSEGTFGVIMIDLTTGMKRYTRNVSLIFPAASLIKVPIAVTVYQQASQGIINLDAELTMDASVIVGAPGRCNMIPLGVPIRCVNWWPVCCMIRTIRRPIC
ncbi:MAG: hypothetical protein HC837_11760 [Chloroflexaceae bacterium]|nr:hypothetical protein [Chloroflexaceae bacterium]